MMSKCKISAHHRDDSLHLILSGELNDVSICELIDVLKDNCDNSRRVFIHTDSLNNVAISGFGQDVFKKNMTNFNDNSVHIEFMSGNGIKPEAFGCYYAE